MSLRVNALVLAAGRSSRMGGPNKLLATFDGEPLIRRTVETAMASRAEETFVVLGHRAETIRAVLDGCDVAFIDNPDFAEGLSTSLKLGFGAASAEADGVLVVLADQPALSAAHLDALVDAFDSRGGGSIVVATNAGEWGNPVLLPASLLAAIEAITGDRGARAILQANAALVREVEVGAAALLDVDTPQAMRDAGGVLPPNAPPRRS